MDAEDQVDGTVDDTAVAASGDGPGAEPVRQPDWWHRDHPTFTSITGFFTGLAFIILVPGTYAALLRAFVDNETAEELFPLVLVTLAVPIGLALTPRTRRFGRYMVIGIVTTAIVVLGTAALVLWYLYSTES